MRGESTRPGHHEIAQQGTVVITSSGLGALVREPLKTRLGRVAVATDCPVMEPEMPEKPLKADILRQKSQFPRMVGSPCDGTGLLPERQTR